MPIRLTLNEQTGERVNDDVRDVSQVSLRAGVVTLFNAWYLSVDNDTTAMETMFRVLFDHVQCLYDENPEDINRLDRNLFVLYGCLEECFVMPELMDAKRITQKA